MRATATGATAETIGLLKQAWETGDFAQVERTALDHWTSDTTKTYPQSGEVFRGAGLVQAMSDSYEDATDTKPTFTPRDIRASGELLVAEGTVDYGNGETAEAVSISEIRDGKIVRETEYFAAPFEAPEWRRPFRETTG